MKKTFCFLILTTILLLCFAGCSTSPSDKYFTYEETEGGLMITAVLSTAGKIEIPSEHGGKPVVAIKESAFYRNENLRSLTIPASVAYIGSYAFSDCPKLQTVVFEKGGRCSIDDSAFEGCTLLGKLRFNASVVSVGDRAFKDCRRVGLLKVGGELTQIGQDAFMNCERMLFSAPRDSVAYAYAAENNLPTSFFDSLYFLYIQIFCAVLAAVALLILFRWLSKKRKNKRKNST